jgi:hypothetical protein
VNGDAQRPGQRADGRKGAVPPAAGQAAVQEQEEPVAPRVALNGLARACGPWPRAPRRRRRCPRLRQALAWLWGRAPYGEALALALAH